MFFNNTIYDNYKVTLADGNKYLLYESRHINDKTYKYVRNTYILKTVRSVINEDWETAIAHNQPAIPPDTEILVKDVIWNFYGQFITTEYDGYYYYLNPKDLLYIRCEEEEIPTYENFNV